MLTSSFKFVHPMPPILSAPHKQKFGKQLCIVENRLYNELYPICSARIDFAGVSEYLTR